MISEAEGALFYQVLQPPDALTCWGVRSTCKLHDEHEEGEGCE